MREPVFILLTFLFLGISQWSDAQGINRGALREPKVNVGLKAGFNSSMFFIDRFAIGNQKLQDIQNNYKVGYFGAFFCRFNLKKHHFIQTELSYNISKGSISIPDVEENIGVLADDALVKTDIHSIDLPLLYGYKFIDAYPYGMAFFVGPKVAYIWDKQSQSEYSGFYQQNIVEEIEPFCFSGVLGLSVNISNIFFDFRYEVGLHNMIHSMTFDKQQTESPYNEQELLFKRRRNVLSFSLGVIF